MAGIVPRFHRSLRGSESYQAYVKGDDPNAWDALRKELQPTIDSALQSFANGDKSLRVRAMIIAKKAVDDYDPNNPQGASLGTHVYNRLKRLNRYREQRNSPMHYPESVRNDRRAVYNFKQEFEERHQREPNQSELQDGLGLSARRLRKALGMQQDMPSSAAETEKGHELGQAVDPKELRRRKRMDLVYLDQDNAGKKIMEWGMGYGGANTLPKSQIASKLGISAPAVSQRISKIIDKVEAPELYDQSATDMRPVVSEGLGYN